MRPIWSGAISFGLVTIPIKVVPATESHDISFRQIHTADGGRIRYRKVCELDGQQLRQDEIVRGYETATGTLIPVTDEDLDNLPLPTAKAIEIVSFVPAASIDPIQIGASYYLAATETVAAKPYELLRQALERSSRVAVAKFAMRDRERLGLLRVKDDVIMLHALRWPDEIRSASQVPVPGWPLPRRRWTRLSGSPKPFPAATSGSCAMSTGTRSKVIAAKAAGTRPAPVAEAAAPASAEVVDLMAMLEKSVQDAQATRSEPATVHPTPAAKKSAGKKKSTGAAASKKTTAKGKPRRSATPHARQHRNRRLRPRSAGGHEQPAAWPEPVTPPGQPHRPPCLCIPAGRCPSGRMRTSADLSRMRLGFHRLGRS
ncbi:Ku protein [Streptomyces virginiae]|uniref:non-homologous end joining protein Ku n=1 Tax=Streptomyces virginiae TaxID=1961 RepID=UPI0034311175